MFARSGYHALGVDLAPTAIEIARQDLSSSGAQFASHDFEALPYRQEFDAAVFYDSLHHCGDLDAVLSSAHDALKPGGCLIVVEPGSGHSTTERAREAHTLHGVTERDMPPALSVPILERLEFSSVSIVEFRVREPAASLSYVAEPQGTSGLAVAGTSCRGCPQGDLESRQDALERHRRRHQVAGSPFGGGVDV